MALPASYTRGGLNNSLSCNVPPMTSVPSLAQSLGPTGKLYGLDVSERMLDVAQVNLHKMGLADAGVIRFGQD